MNVITRAALQAALIAHGDDEESRSQENDVRCACHDAAEIVGKLPGEELDEAQVQALVVRLRRKRDRMYAEYETGSACGYSQAVEVVAKLAGCEFPETDK